MHDGIAWLKCTGADQVVGKERDMILARRLWEAAEHSEDVVGIVGAAHVKVCIRTESLPHGGARVGHAERQEG